MKLLLLLGLSLSLFADCIERRAGLDIGSGATKLKVAEVDKCKNRVRKILLERNFAVEYKDDLKTRKNNFFSSDIIKTGIDAFKSISKILKEHKIKSVKAVATSAFRTSRNSHILEKEAKKLGISIQIISQKEEALLGYKSARTLAKSKNYIVWDIGGGSMQMTFKKNSKTLIYEGKLASVPFREYITKKIQVTKKKSPNPMSKKIVSSAVQYAKGYALKDVPKEIQEVLKRKDIDIIGIGGVHGSAILKAMKRKGFYTYSQLKSFLDGQRKLSDKEIGGKYASTSVSNLALVLGFMDAFKIKKVISGKVNLCDGLLLN